MKKIDLNCDLGESFGIYTLGNDKDLLPLVSSVNIACGFHAGDATTMRKTVHLAHKYGLAIGAHPGLPDLNGFGRRNMDITPEEAHDIVIYQIGALSAFAAAEGASLKHVKPHGALYNMASQNYKLARAIANAVYQVDPSLILFGLSGSELIQAGEDVGLRTASEVFADRTYRADGSLTPRREPDALVTDPEEAALRVIRMVQEGIVVTREGEEISILADTICLHGDGPHAIDFAKVIRSRCEEAGILIRPAGDSESTRGAGPKGARA